MAVDAGLPPPLGSEDETPYTLPASPRVTPDKEPTADWFVVATVGSAAFAAGVIVGAAWWYLRRHRPSLLS
jgi:hypothetical protein